MTPNPTQSSSEELDLLFVVNQIVDGGGDAYDKAKRIRGYFTTHLQAYTDEIRMEVIGDKKISLTDIYGIDWRNNYGYNETQVRDAAIYLQCKQRQAFNRIATKWGVK